jgi:hypothetical protein
VAAILAASPAQAQRSQVRKAPQTYAEAADKSDASGALPSEAVPFQDLRGVRIVIRPLGSKDKQLGLMESEVRQLIEVELKKAGIRVLQPNDRKPHLYIHVNTVESNAIYASTIHLALKQAIRLARMPTVTIYTGETWGATITFIELYLEANSSD